MTTKTQTRGNCQCCGRDQAVVGSKMSKHGYTVDHGWFNGVCTGQRFAPLQVERAQADKIAADVLAQATELQQRAEELKAGTRFPKTVTGSWDFATKTYAQIPFADADQWKQREAVKSAIWQTEQRAKAGRDFSAELTAMANKVHGTPVRIVPVEGGPAPIVPGEKRMNGARLMIAANIEKGRVYWKASDAVSGRTFTWLGLAAWRKLPLAV